jgi:EmrB/QacA subfamily drug resistance transporter
MLPALQSFATAAGMDARTEETQLTPDGAVAAPVDHATVRAVMAGIMLAMFLSALEQTIVAPALPAVGASLGDIENLSWIVTAYLLAATAATPLFGKLSDIHGRRTIMLLGIGIFVAGSVACALAPTMLALIIARAVQGIGGGGLLPIAQTVIADLVTPRERARVQGYTAVMFMTASILGPILGGVLTDHFHWSLIFWINLPLGVVAVGMTGRALRRLPQNHRPHRLDMLGAALMVVAAVALMLALAWGGVRYRWGSWQILALIAASAALWSAFAIRLLVAREPFIPLSILREPVTSTMTCAAFFSIGTFIGITIYTPLYFQTVLNYSASTSGLALIAFMAGATFASLVAGRVLARVGHYMRVPKLGLLIAIAALAMLAADPAGRSAWEVTLLLGLLGCGIGPMYPISTVVIQNAVKPHQFGTATGAVNFFRSLGGAFIVAAFGAIVLGAVGNDVEALGPGKLAIAANLSSGHAADLVSAFRWVFVAGAVCLAVALACLLAMKEHPLQGPQLPVPSEPNGLHG